MFDQEFTLPFPPSVNRYWRLGRGHFHVSPAGQLYRRKVKAACYQQKIKKVDGELKLVIDIYPPDKRRRDIDNICKAVLDCLEHAKIYDNDYQISELILRRSAEINNCLKLKLSANDPVIEEDKTCKLQSNI